MTNIDQGLMLFYIAGGIMAVVLLLFFIAVKIEK